MKMYLIIFILIALSPSCKKPKGEQQCIWEKETTDMHLGIGKMKFTTSYDNCNSLDSLDTCNYSLFQAGMLFDTKYLPYKVCSTPSDSLIGTIDKIYIICKNKYKNKYKINDTINDIVSLIYIKQNGMYSSIPISLNSYIQTKPVCTRGIKLFLNQPPDTTSLQMFNIIYKESNGAIYTSITKPIYINP